MNWDTTLFYWLHGLTGEAGAFDGLVVFLAEYLQYFVFIALVILLYFSAYSGREKIKIFSVAALSPLIATLIKYFIRFFYHRPRPFLTHEIQALFTNDSGSFPSGHATIFFALATSLYLYNKKWGFWFFLAAFLISISRIIAGVHYPTDIIGGAILGMLVAYVAVRIAARKS